MNYMGHKYVDLERIIGHTDHEGSAGPREGATGIEIGSLLQHLQLTATDAQNLFLEGLLPRIQLQHLKHNQCFNYSINGWLLYSENLS